VGAATDLCEACCDGEEVLLAATLPVPRRVRWKMVLATRNVDFPAPRPDGSIHWVRGNGGWQGRIDGVFEWCVGNYGRGFGVPRVRVVRGVAEGMSSLEKVVIEHPL